LADFVTCFGRHAGDFLAAFLRFCGGFLFGVSGALGHGNAPIADV
jgi:hypothetical protein